MGKARINKQRQNKMIQRLFAFAVDYFIGVECHCYEIQGHLFELNGYQYPLPGLK